ncbi:MAG: DUF1211 domain-containing protein [Anaerolineae bacterium]|nr:DUF1211 domain-containing protein [Anaerolineae bacterium]
MKRSQRVASDDKPHSADAFGLERLVFFSDAVFAIAITLLVLDIRLPETEGLLTDGQLRDALVGLGHQYLAYILSFLVIGVFWIGHHRRYRFIHRYDGMLLFLNLLLLMIVAFVPFPSALISRYPSVTATIFYAGVMVAAGIVSLLIWGYASYNHRLIDPALSPQVIRREYLTLLATPLVFLTSIGIALIDPELAKLAWILIAPTRLLLRGGHEG